MADSPAQQEHERGGGIISGLARLDLPMQEEKRSHRAMETDPARDFAGPFATEDPP